MMAGLESDNAPQVSGISPSEGPLGTRITIRGSNLGVDAMDVLSVLICDCDCTKYVKWVNSGKLLCTFNSKTVEKPLAGRVVVKTRSGGEGSCAVRFRLIFDRIKPLVESSVWLEEEYDSLLPGHSEVMEAGPNEAAWEPDPLNIIPGSSYSIGTPTTHESVVKYSAHLADPNFHPVRFLLERHSGTSWKALRRGYDELKRSLDLDAGGETKNENMFVVKNVNMIISVVSDMSKLAYLVGQRRTPTSSYALRANIKSLVTGMSARYNKLVGVYKGMLSCMNLLQLYDAHTQVLNIPRLVRNCVDCKSDHQTVLRAWVSLQDLDAAPPDPMLDKIFQSIQECANRFIGGVVDGLVNIYPVYYPGLLQLVKAIDNFRLQGQDPIVMVVQSHQKWLVSKFDSVSDAYRRRLARLSFYLDSRCRVTEQLTDFGERMVRFINDLCVFCSREHILIQTLLESRSAVYRKANQSARTMERVVPQVMAVDRLLARIFQRFYASLQTMLFEPLTVVFSQEGGDSACNPLCLLTSLTPNQFRKVIDWLVSTLVGLHSGPYLTMVASLRTAKNDAISLSYYDEFVGRFAALLVKILECLRDHCMDCIKVSILTNRSPQRLLRLSNSFGDDAVPTSEHLIRWLSLLHLTLTRVGDLDFISPDLIRDRLETVCRADFLREAMISQLDLHLKGTCTCVVTDLALYYRMLSVTRALADKLVSLPFLRPSGEEAPSFLNTIGEDMRAKCESVEEYLRDTLLKRTCQLSLAPVFHVIEEGYLNKDASDDRPSVCGALLRCIRRLRQQCLQFNLIVYKHALHCLFSVLLAYLQALELPFYEALARHLFENKDTVLLLISELKVEDIGQKYRAFFENQSRGEQTNADENVCACRAKQFLDKWQDTVCMLAVTQPL